MRSIVSEGERKQVDMRELGLIAPGLIPTSQEIGTEFGECSEGGFVRNFLRLPGTSKILSPNDEE